MPTSAAHAGLAAGLPFCHGHAAAKMGRQVLDSFVPAMRLELAETADALKLVLPMLQEMEIRLPPFPFPAAVEFVQMLPQVIFARKGSLGHGAFCTRLKLVRLDVFI